MPRKQRKSAANPASSNYWVQTSGKNISYWIDSAPGKSFAPLHGNITADVVVVGAGIAGITIAYLLAKAGKNVTVLEDGNIGSGETGRTTAHLVNALDDRYSDLEKYFGERNARLAIESHTAAVDLIEKIVHEEKVECDFQRLDGYLFLHPTDKLKSLEEDLKAAQKLGLSAVTMLEQAPISSFHTGPCLLYPRQAQFHPMKYLNQLAEKIFEFGGNVFTGTHAASFHKEGVTTSEGFRVKADHIVVATNSPVNDRVTMHTKQGPYRTYVVALRVPKGSVPKILLWDTGDQNVKPYPYHYIRLQNLNSSSDLLIVGGEDHKTGQAEDWEHRFQILEEWTRERFPTAKDVLYHWSGQVMEPIDSLAFIGRNPGDENIYICTGDSGNGMTHGTIAGMLISDLILKKANPWEEVYDPSRITLRAATDFVEENVNVMKQYSEWVQRGDIRSVEELAPGQGGVLKEGIHPIAVYRDPTGKLHANSAVCVHLGCIVHWNDEEKTFDCPCHGSRFTYEGKVINGPANEDLESAPVPVVEKSAKR
jgi:glycine/D-amino acid oxidase-like deaminating enzyme/nitrite reductase/ring-hydroxylating ferredoxin subunit